MRVGNQPRLGIAGQDDSDDIVQGIVLMRRGAESMPTIRAVEALVSNINTTGILPPGVHIARIYDRSDLIQVTTHTVHAQSGRRHRADLRPAILFLGDLRAALIVAATIPFALSFAIGLILLRGESANLLSVGAIDFGLIVDATVIMMENIIRRMSQPAAERFPQLRAAAAPSRPRCAASARSSPVRRSRSARASSSRRPSSSPPSCRCSR